MVEGWQEICLLVGFNFENKIHLAALASNMESHGTKGKAAGIAASSAASGVPQGLYPARASIRCAIWKSFWVRPPASWVVSARVTRL